MQALSQLYVIRPFFCDLYQEKNLRSVKILMLKGL
jgi:hypothetical protein